MHDKREQGLTMVELMVVLAVLAILVSLAMPSWQSFMARQKRDVLASQLTGHLALARSLAIGRGRSVAVSTLGDGWHSGWRVHLETQHNGQWDLDEPVLMNHSGDTQARMVGNGPLRRYVIFGSDGRPVQSNGSFLAGSIQICMPSNRGVIALVMSATGRVRQEFRQTDCP
jgi:type IV fimbrial biogenesis protein FimT